jgi:DNA-binding response OmpR family regulator
MNYKILSVDDSRTIRMIVKKAFQQYSCDIVEAENGAEGLELAAKEKPDLIVLDITMPVMTGIEMLAKLKEDDALKSIPVIMLTAEGGKDNVMNIVKMGVKDYIVKPFKGEQLIERARNIIDLKHGGNKIDPKDSVPPKDWFTVDGDILLLSLPAKVSRSMCAQADSTAKDKIAQMNASWANKLIIDIGAVADVNMNIIQLIVSLINHCVQRKIPARMVASDAQAEALKGFKETSTIHKEPTVEHARTSFQE